MRFEAVNLVELVELVGAELVVLVESVERVVGSPAAIVVALVFVVYLESE